MIEMSEAEILQKGRIIGFLEKVKKADVEEIRRATGLSRERVSCLIKSMIEVNVQESDGRYSLFSGGAEEYRNR